MLSLFIPLFLILLLNFWMQDLVKVEKIGYFIKQNDIISSSTTEIQHIRLYKLLPYSNNTHGSDHGYHQHQQSGLTRNNPQIILRLLYNDFQTHVRRLKSCLSRVTRINNRRRCERSLTSFLVPMATNKAGPAVFHGAHQRGRSTCLTPADWLAETGYVHAWDWMKHAQGEFLDPKKKRDTKAGKLHNRVLQETN